MAPRSGEVVILLLASGDHKSHMIQHVENLRTWSQANKMIINLNKTKEMVLGCLAKQPIGLPCLATQSGITLSNDLSWEAHISAICAKVAPRLYYLKQLRRAGLITFWRLTVFLFDGNKTCPRIWLCSLTPWLNCCTIPKTGVFAEEGPENHPPNCIRYAT